MCGIAGILSADPRQPASQPELRRMTNALRHRGPDDEGFYVDPAGRCGLAFRRLSIIDLSGGAQPMPNEDGSLWLVFNGEIYNYGELREELLSRGHRFRTQTDSEVVLHLFEESGSAAFARLEGMYALALWDVRRGGLTLARDRLGKKPLVYARVGERVLFASEAKALLALPDTPREIDPQALHEYLVLQYVPAPQSIFRRFAKLPPATHLTIEPGKPVPAPHCYWQPRAEPFRGSYADARVRLGELLRAAVRKRLIADVPLGAFLSGGVDSSVVVLLMQQLGVHPLRTFSIGFDDAGFDERVHARRVARLAGAEHQEFVVAPDALGLLDTLAHHLDEPLADSSALPTWHVAHLTRGFVTVALTGDGGDECFLGYDRYRGLRFAEQLGILPSVLRRGLAAVGARLPRGQGRSPLHRAFRFLSTLDEPPARRYLTWMQAFDPRHLARAYNPDFADRVGVGAPLEWFGSFFDAHRDPVTAANRCDLAGYLPGDLLAKVDLMSMACSLECRCPLLDHALVEFALSLPTDWKLRRSAGKRILRDFAADLLPPGVLDRPKMGFGVPVGAWFRGPLAPILRELCAAPRAITAQIFRPGFVAALLEEHQSGRQAHDYRLWSLLMLELWGHTWRPSF